MSIVYYMIYFFQAEDGIRVADVTGVQTCALPICVRHLGEHPFGRLEVIADDDEEHTVLFLVRGRDRNGGRRSEERRVGKDCSSKLTKEWYRKNIRETSELK